MSALTSTCPATEQTIWEGRSSAPWEVNEAVDQARAAFNAWSSTPLDERIVIARTFAKAVSSEADQLATVIARETGKPFWEARQEVASVVGKIELSIKAQAERAGAWSTGTAFGTAHLRHRPHGVVAVFGPYNFPGHLPNGHIVPALLAGNTVVFKPSELTPWTGEYMVRLWADAGLPHGVLSLVQGGRDVGECLAATDIDGLFFTGSAATGAALRRSFADRPNVILALELGGNSPIVAWDGDPDAIASIVVQSAFATSGQRCSCARRLIIPAGETGDSIVGAVVTLARRMTVGAWDENPEPALGPLVSAAAADRAYEAVARLISAGARTLLSFERPPGRSAAFVTPSVLDVTGCEAPDEEIFAPVLQVVRVDDFDAALRIANATRFGLAAGLVSDRADLWDLFAARVRAGVLNWNRPTTGASGEMPFGGLGESGNHRPSAYYAADYSAFPTASFEAAAPVDLTREMRGLGSSRKTGS